MSKPPEAVANTKESCVRLHMNVERRGVVPGTQPGHTGESRRRSEYRVRERHGSEIPHTDIRRERTSSTTEGFLARLPLSSHLLWRSLLC